MTRTAGVVLTTLFGIPFLLLAWQILDSRFNPASTDYHGYALIFGTVFAIPLALATSLVVPLIFSRGRRRVAYRVSAFVFVVVAVGLLAAWFTAA
ncbi:hypothetical protein [Actinomadura sp. HBU206391]|uniref:hypothetical protein n=1 Tax=Actinomadura sp. HBU206391 TaxID=2731692 RepID=UPI00164FD0F7|nr:hypothetical protein [Actinomadura sp. HBU206391]MBC6458128.1 hypothetical protein [Actinomadura sp. HBU206391]